MKKLLYFAFVLFSLSMVVSCGDSDDDGDDTEKFDDWNDPKSPNYKPGGYNPIEGEWRHKASEGKYYFTEDFKIKATSIGNDGKWSTNWSFLATYKINDKEFLTSSGLDIFGGGGTEFTYTLEKEDGVDVLIVRQNYKYYRVTE